MRELGHGARHMPIRGHHDQRVEIVLARPILGLERVAEGIERGTVEIDAAGEKLGIERGQPRDFARSGVAVHAADQQSLAALGRQQFDGIRNARGGPGQRHDAVGLAVECHFLGRNAQDKPAESGAQQHGARGAGGHGEKADDARDACQHFRAASFRIDSKFPLTFFLRMIFSENRFPLFGIMR
jgi:hypothetical protein